MKRCYSEHTTRYCREEKAVVSDSESSGSSCDDLLNPIEEGLEDFEVGEQEVANDGR